MNKKKLQELKLKSRLKWTKIKKINLQEIKIKKSNAQAHVL